MSTFLKGLRRPGGESVSTAPAPRSGNSSVTPSHAALEALVARAEAAAEQLRSLAPLAETAEAADAMQQRFTALEYQLAAVERLAARFSAAEEQADRVAKTQADTESGLARAVDDVERVQSQMGALSDKVDTALVVRDELDKFLGDQSPVLALQTDADALRTQLVDLADGVGRIRTQHDDALRAHRHITSRLETFDQEHQAAGGRLEELVRRVATAEQVLEPLTQAVDAIPNIQHQLGVLRALTDQVAQKSATLEQQRDAVERAATQISQLTRLDRELDTWLRRQEEHMRRFGAIEAKIGEVHAVHAKVLSRTEELETAQKQAGDAQQSARQALTDLREQMRKSSEAFELENRGLHAVSERVADLRTGVKECEARFAVLDISSQGTAAVQAQVRALTEQAVGLSRELLRLSEEASRIGTMRQDADRLEALADEVAGRMQRIQQLKPGVDEVVQQLTMLKGTHEMVADGLEQMQLAHGEMSRLRETHAETQAWLTSADAWTRKVQTQVKELGAMEPAVDRIRSEVEQVQGTMADIASRQSLIDEVHRRLAELGSLSTELKDRTDGLRARMDGAETRFTQLARHADEAQRVSDAIGGVIASVAGVEQRIGVVDDSVHALEARAQEFNDFEQRIRLLGQELEQRRGALDKAMEHLNRASALRQESADTAHRLEEISRTIGSTLVSAEGRAGGLERVSGELEARARALKPIEGQLTHFEALLATWESVQGEAARALEQTLARQGAVEALEGQVKHVFGLAERAVDHVQTIGAARREIEETRTLLEATQAQFQASEEALQGFEARKRQLERTEQRLARAEALALNVRSTVDSLQAQRTVADHVIERAGALAFQMKQAEALVETLRRERTLACDVKAAVAAMQDDEESAPGR